MLWNSLPLEVRQLTSLNVLKPKLKNLSSIVKLLKLAIRNFYPRPPCKAGFFLSSLFDGALNFSLACLTRNIGCKMFFHNKVVVPSGYGEKKSLSVFPFNCVYSRFGNCFKLLDNHN